MNKEVIEIPLVKATYEELQEVICELQVERIIKDKEIERLNNIIEEKTYLYNKLSTESEYAINKLNNIIDELEKWLEDLDKYTTTMSSVIYIDNMREKLKELKEGEKNVKD